MKTALVTGTTSGIGRVLVKEFLDRGWQVIAHARSQEKLDKEMASWPKGNVHAAIADLASKKDVARMADEIGEKFPKIDVIMNNAAVSPKARVEIDGMDACFTTNVLAPFILAKRLEPQLRAAAPSRVILFFGGNSKQLDVAVMRDGTRKPYDGFVVYSATKNACAALAREMAAHWKGSGISVFAVIPGVVNTEGMRGLGFPFSLLAPLMFRTPEQGTRTPMWVATEEGLEAQSGKCFGNALGSGWRNETKLPEVASDPAIGEQVYALCEREAP
ncbi:MAG TPA: SDR family NAD(P)-dependent oxidoreductase [Polyangiaceae bacterium]